jgi:hypothetical protein
MPVIREILGSGSRCVLLPIRQAMPISRHFGPRQLRDLARLTAMKARFLAGTSRRRSDDRKCRQFTDGSGDIRSMNMTMLPINAREHLMRVMTLEGMELWASKFDFKSRFQ